MRCQAVLRGQVVSRCVQNHATPNSRSESREIQELDVSRFLLSRGWIWRVQKGGSRISGPGDSYHVRESGVRPFSYSEFRKFQPRFRTYLRLVGGPQRSQIRFCFVRTWDSGILICIWGFPTIISPTITSNNPWIQNNNMKFTYTCRYVYVYVYIYIYIYIQTIAGELIVKSPYGT